MKKILFSIAVIISALPLYAHAEADRHLLNEMLTTLNRQYLYPVDNAAILINGLQALHDLDNSFTISKGHDKFYIYRNHQLKKSIPFPKDKDDINGWVDTASKTIETAASISEQISLKDFEIPDLMMKKISAVLDEYTHYYSEYDYDEKQNENSIYTLYGDRVIDEYLYIRVRIFNKQTALKVKNSLTSNTFKGVILDLRGNSGGMLNEALKIADFFTDSQIITYTSERNGENIHYYTSTEEELYKGPLVILVDGDTASAAEVLAASMQEQSRAKLVGSTTFGKGTIQNVILMSNGGKLALTTAQFFTPSGKKIHKHGVEPDICLAPQTSDNCSRQKRLHEQEDIATAIKLLKNEL